jgi:hypothetical protein
MKRSKVFLTLTTLCLTIVAVAATKVKQKALADGYFTNGTGHCNVVGSTACTTAGSVRCTNGASVPLYTLAAGECVHPINRH